MKTRTVAFLAGICCLVICGCKEEKPVERLAPEVTVSVPVQEEVVDYAEFTGRVQAKESVDIRARVKGFLEKVNFADGAVVEEGQVLFVIEKEPFKAALAAAEAKKLQTQAAQRLAKANLDRATTLRQQNVITAEDYQTKVAEKEAADAQLKADEAAIEQAQIDLDYTDIFSPIRGLAGRKLVDVGNLVGTDGNTLLTTVVQIDKMHAYFDISEGIARRYLQQIADSRRSGEESKDAKPSPVFLRLEGEDGYPHEGFLDFFDNTIDSATGTGLVRGEFPNPDEVMRPGMYAWLRVPRKMQAEQKSLLVKEDALGTAALGVKYLLIVNDENIVEQRNVELGTLIDGMRVIRSGIKAGDHYVSNGMQFARPGMPVKPTMETQPEPEAEDTPPAKQPTPRDVERSKPKDAEQGEPDKEPAKEPEVEMPTESTTP